MKKIALKGLIAFGIAGAVSPFFLSSCSVTAVRPSQEMSNMEVAIRAAKEVNADVLAPELYRLAAENGQLARREYRFKNFQDAKKLADKARNYAEKAEFESIRNGGKRESLPQDPLSEPSYAPEPLGTPLDGGASPAPATGGAPGAGAAPPTTGAAPK
jgi:hypothetical protein